MSVVLEEKPTIHQTARSQKFILLWTFTIYEGVLTTVSMCGYHKSRRFILRYP